jgi:protein arginine N-methyltransferase 1
VYAIDPSDAVQIAVEAARDNGYADRIVVIQKRSTDVTLPERADVIVSDMRGILPQLQTHLLDIADARERLLAPTGQLIPRTDTLWLAPLEAADLFEERVAPWANRQLGFDLRSGLPYVANCWKKAKVKPNQLLSDPLQWATLDYCNLTSPRVVGGGRTQVMRDGTAHGLAVWFDAVLTESVGFSNAPAAPELIYGQAYFPWPEAVAMREGDEVECRIRADLSGGDYVWSWDSAVSRRESPDAVDVRFRQSTFLGTPLTPESLARRAASHVPHLSVDGEITVAALQRMYEGASLGALAEDLSSQHPERFRSPREALDFVSALSAKYGRQSPKHRRPAGIVDAVLPDG